jgi:predicted transcriptional regulator
MNIRTDHQIIKKDGRPVFVLVPWDEYTEYITHQQSTDEKNVYFPHEVVELHAIEEKSLVRAWREYKKLSQKQVADRMNVTQAAYSQMEKPDAKLRKPTLKKIAVALKVEIEQLEA